MNAKNELALAIKHLANYVGSGLATGFTRDVSICALGALRWIATLEGVVKFKSGTDLLNFFENEETF